MKRGKQRWLMIWKMERCCKRVIAAKMAYEEFMGKNEK